MNMRRYTVLGVGAFLLNVIWENFHAQWYVHYKNSSITELILLQASVVDMLYITVAVFFARRFSIRPIFFLIPFWLIVAVCIEWWALSTGRWAYRESMLIIPVINTGLSPTIQLACTGALAYRFVFGTKKSI